MVQQVLYRKYRSKKLSEIIGQEHITKSLSEALKSDRLSHAYLFSGPKGVGKTSVARILAHEINKLPYNDDQPNIDIIEIDAASNRRIDEIRDLRDKVHILPTSAPYKVYIIDEVHMLTKEAFNALLKTLEEPPAHVIFILATTDPHKLPDTIISRTQRFSFKPIDPRKAASHLRLIANKEKIKINDQALRLIAAHGEGSFRDSISLLDQLGHQPRQISEEDVLKLLGIPPTSAINELVELLDSPATSYQQLSEELTSLYNQGFGPSLIARGLMNELRDKLIAGKLRLPAQEVISLLKELLKIDASADPQTYLLLCLMNEFKDQSALSPTKARTKTSSAAEVKQPPAITKDVKQTKKTVKKLATDTNALWKEVLNELKTRYNTLYGIVRMAEPFFKDNHELDLIFDFAFHQKQVLDPRNRQLISDIILKLTGTNYIIKARLNETGRELKTMDNLTVQAKSQDLANINKIFGGAEVVD